MMNPLDSIVMAFCISAVIVGVPVLSKELAVTLAKSNRNHDDEDEALWQQIR